MNKIKNIINEEIKKMLNESISFMVSDYNYEDKPQNLLNLKWLIWNKVSNDLIKKMNPFQIERYRKEGYYEGQIEVDEKDDVFGTLGTLFFYFKGIPEEFWDFVKESTIKILQAYNIKYREPTMEGNVGIKFIVAFSPEEIAPEMNLSNNNARKLMQDFLGYKDFEYNGEYAASDMLMRVSTAYRTLESSDMRSTYGITKQDLRKNIYSGEIGKETIMRYLAGLKEVCEYAIKHGYDKIYVG